MGENSIRFYRLCKGITQVDLARSVGVTQQAVAKWETSNTNVRLEYVPQLAKALGIKKELLFPELRDATRAERTREDIEDALEYVLPYAVIIHFKNRDTPYWAEISGENHRRIDDLVYSTNSNFIWFETLDNMVAAVNRKQIKSIELGRDLCPLPENMLLRQVLGDVNPDFEEKGDDRRTRLMLSGRAQSIEGSPEPTEDGTLLSLLSDALGDMLIMDEFHDFEIDTFEDTRRIYFRPEDLELIEGPKIYFESYMDRMNAELQAASQAATPPIGQKLNPTKSKVRAPRRKSEQHENRA